MLQEGLFTYPKNNGWFSSNTVAKNGLFCDCLLDVFERITYEMIHLVFV